MFVIAGLGNPGKEYERTRHNAGFLALEKIKEAFDFSEWKKEKVFDALLSSGTITGKKAVLLAPQTYMNKSGAAVAKFLKKHDSASSGTLLVIYDDIDLPLGKIKLSYDRSSGGHNGVESIIASLGTKAFFRLRIGISASDAEGHAKKPKAKSARQAFVMKNFTEREKTVFEKTATEMIDAVRSFIEESEKR